MPNDLIGVSNMAKNTHFAFRPPPVILRAGFRQFWEQRVAVVAGRPLQIDVGVPEYRDDRIYGAQIKREEIAKHRRRNATHRVRAGNDVTRYACSTIETLCDHRKGIVTYAEAWNDKLRALPRAVVPPVHESFRTESSPSFCGGRITMNTV